MDDTSKSIQCTATQAAGNNFQTIKADHMPSESADVLNLGSESIKADHMPSESADVLNLGSESMPITFSNDLLVLEDEISDSEVSLSIIQDNIQTSTEVSQSSEQLNFKVDKEILNPEAGSKQPPTEVSQSSEQLNFKVDKEILNPEVGSKQPPEDSRIRSSCQVSQSRDVELDSSSKELESTTTDHNESHVQTSDEEFCENQEEMSSINTSNIPFSKEQIRTSSILAIEETNESTVPIDSYAAMESNPEEVKATSSDSENPVLGYIDEGILKRVRLLEQRVDESLFQTSKSLVQDFQSIKQTFDDFMESQATLIKEMSSKGEMLKTTLRSIVQSQSLANSSVLDHLEACFNVGQWLEKSVKIKRVTDLKELIKDFVTVEYGGIVKVQSIIEQHSQDRSTALPNSFVQPTEPINKCDPFLVNVSHVTDPGEFYVVRMCDMEIRNTIFSSLKAAASTYPIPEEIIPGQMYAVLNSGLNWYRGVCGKECGRCQVGDGPPEILYEFFLPDQGHHEHITVSSVRVLPDGLLKYPPMARECTLNHNFQKVSWSVQAIASFKQMVRRSPLSMKVFNQEGGVLDVDLAQLPCFGEESNIVSIRDALFFTNRPLSSNYESIPLKFKPKFDAHNTESGNDPIKHLSVEICNALTPFNIHVRALDKDYHCYEQMQQDLQTELNSLAMNTNSIVSHPIKGHPYALKYKDEWYRILVEDVQKNRVVVYYVDTGHRQTTSPHEFVKLPEKFMDLPAQAFRCALDGVNVRNPPGPRSRRLNLWSRETMSFLRQYDRKKAIVFVENLLVGDVGRAHGQEFVAYVTAYADGEQESLNVKMTRAGLTISTKKHERPEHKSIRSALVSQRIQLVPKMKNGSLSISTSSDERIITAIPSDAHLVSSAPITPDANSQLPNFLNPENVTRLVLNSSNSIESTQSMDVEANLLAVETMPTVDAPPRQASQASMCTGDALLASFSDADSSISMESNTVQLTAGRTPFPDADLLLGNSNKTTMEISEQMNNPWDNYTYTFESAPHSQSMTKSYLSDAPIKQSSFDFASKMALRSDNPKPNHDNTVSTKSRHGLSRNVMEKSTETKSKAESVSDSVALQGTQSQSEEVMEVFFSWCDSPHAIFVRTDEMKNDFRLCRNQMQTYYATANLAKLKASNFEVGFLGAVFTDSKWWRAEVICMDEYPKCDVCLVDTGYQRKVMAQDIFKLATEFEGYKRLSLKCSLQGIFPPPSGIWDAAAWKYISERLLGSEEITIYRRGNPRFKNDELPVVLLYTYNLEDGPLQIAGKTRINLNDELVEKKLAFSHPEFQSPTNLPPAYRVWKPVESLGILVGAVFWGKVTWVNMEGEIFLHDVKVEPTLNEITKWLNQTYNDTEPSEKDVLCRMGDVCIAKYIDKSWYRGIVRETNFEPGKVNVFFVDYGTLDAVDRRDIRLNIMLEDLPIQALRCVLHNIQPLVGDEPARKSKWSIETLNTLHRWIVDNEYRVIVKGKGPPLQVVLTTNRTSIGKEMVNTSMAEFIKVKKKFNRKKGSQRKE